MTRQEAIDIIKNLSEFDKDIKKAILHAVKAKKYGKAASLIMEYDRLANREHLADALWEGKK